MIELNLPKIVPKVKKENGKLYIFDGIRRKYVVLTPEEWVRQHVIYYLTAIKKYPKGLIAVEKQITLNNLNKRIDIGVFKTDNHLEILVECKAPSVPISQKTFDQIAQYNMKFNASILLVTNGIQHYFCTVDHKNQNYQFLKEIPSY